MILLNGKEIEFGVFPNGETHVKTKISIMEVANETNTISFKYENDSDLIKLMFLKNHIDTLVISPCDLVIYYMPYSRMDRSEGGSVFTLKYVARMINLMYFQTVYVIEPHSDVTCAVLDNAIPIMVNFSLVKDVMERVGFDPEMDYLVFPDAGAQKRYHSLKYPHLVGFKERNFETGKIESLQLVGKEFPASTGRKAIIVDDLSSYGGTFLLTAEALKPKGFDEIYLLVAHAENSIFKGELFKSGLIDKIFTTNSLITEHNFWSSKFYQDKLHVYDVEEILHDKSGGNINV